MGQSERVCKANISGGHCSPCLVPGPLRIEVAVEARLASGVGRELGVKQKRVLFERRKQAAAIAPLFLDCCLEE